MVIIIMSIYLHGLSYVYCGLESCVAVKSEQYLALKDQNGSLDKLRAIAELRRAEGIVFEEFDDGKRRVSGVDFTNNEKLDKKTFEQLLCLEELEELLLAGTRVQDQWLYGIGRLANLKKLVMGDTPVTDKGLFCLRKNKHLEFLNLVNCSITDLGVLQLRDFRKIKSLSLSGTKITNESLPLLDSLSLLSSLSVAETRINDQGFMQRPILAGLELLDVSRTFVSERGLSEVGRDGKMTFLYAADCKVTKLRWLRDKRWRNLRTLDISGNRIVDDEFRNIDVLSQLETLYLARTLLTGKSLITILALPNVKMLDLRGTTIKKAELSSWPAQKLKRVSVRFD